MDKAVRPFLEVTGSPVRILPQNALNTPATTGQTFALLLSRGDCLGFDSRQKFANSLPIAIGIEVFPARKGRELKRLLCGEVVYFFGLGRSTDSSHPSAINPYPSHGAALHQGTRTMHSGPIQRVGYQSFFRAVAEDILQPRDLGAGFAGHQNGGVPS